MESFAHHSNVSPGEVKDALNAMNEESLTDTIVRNYADVCLQSVNFELERRDPSVNLKSAHPSFTASNLKTVIRSETWSRARLEVLVWRMTPR